MTNKQKNILIGLAVLAIIVVAAVFVMWFGRSGSSPQAVVPSGELPEAQNPASTPGGSALTSSSNSAVVSNGTTSLQPGNAGSAGVLPRSAKTPRLITVQTTSGAPQTYYVTPVDSDAWGDLFLAMPELYDIVYFPGGSFLIMLKDPSLALARQHAEAAFLNLLHVDQKTACTFTVALQVPNNVNSAASGIDYGLSFCPGSKPLPQ